MLLGYCLPLSTRGEAAGAPKGAIRRLFENISINPEQWVLYYYKKTPTLGIICGLLYWIILQELYMSSTDALLQELHLVWYIL